MKPVRLFLANVARKLPQCPQSVPPIGILSLAAHLRTKFDLQIKLVNLRLDDLSEDQLVRQAADFQADIVGFGALITSAHMFGPLTQKTRAALPGALIAIGGPAVTAGGMDLMRQCVADVAVPREGELAFEAVMRDWFEGDRAPRHVPGVIWRDRNGDIVQNEGDTPIITDLDVLPYPAYDLIDVPRYWSAMPISIVPGRKYISLLSSRGCPYQCNFCQHQLGSKFRFHSPEYLVDQIEHYVRTYGIDTVEFLDDVFNLDKKRVLAFTELLTRRNIKVHLVFPNGVRTDILDEEVINALAEAGMDQMTVALESGSPRIQQFMGKRLNIPKFLDNVEHSVRLRVFTHCVNMLGFPTETEEEMWQTINLNLRLPLHSAAFYTVTPFPGTDLYDVAMQAVPEKLKEIDYRDLEINSAKVNVSAVPDHVLFGLQGKAWRRFYLNGARAFRIIRDHPSRLSLIRFAARLTMHSGKGLF